VQACPAGWIERFVLRWFERSDHNSGRDNDFRDASSALPVFLPECFKVVNRRQRLGAYS
jgi:hypothetical protein